MQKGAAPTRSDSFVRVRGAREHNLKNVSLEIPRNALVVFTGVSGSGKSSLAFGTLFAEAQRRYLDSVSPYARRLFDQVGVPDVDDIEGLPPAIALQQQRGSPTTRSSVGSVTTLSNLLRMLYSRAGTYPKGQGILYAESFSANTPEGACPTCQGAGQLFDVTEASMVPDPSLTIREKAIAAWPSAWQGQNLRDILTTLGYDIDTPWRDLPKKDRNWILFTDEQPTVPVFAGFTRAEVKQAIRRKEEPSYQGTFTGAKKYVFHTFRTTQSALMRERVARFMLTRACHTCHGKRLNREALSVTFAGLDIADIARVPLSDLQTMLVAYQKQKRASRPAEPEKAEVARRIVADVVARLRVILDLGLGYLTLERSTPTLSPGELQRLRLATQVRSNLFGVVYVLDEPSAGLHPADTEALLRALDGLKASGNSLFVVEHEVDVIRHADWLVDVGPEAGQHGGEVLYSGAPRGLQGVPRSITARYLFEGGKAPKRRGRRPTGWIELSGVMRNNLANTDAAFPAGVLTSVTGISGSGKSTLVAHALAPLLAQHLGANRTHEPEESVEDARPWSATIAFNNARVTRLVEVDQKAIGRTPRSNLATYTGLFDGVRHLFSKTREAKKRRFDAGRFSFNVAKGRCPVCEGEGFVMVELLFLASVYSPCSACHGTRYNEATLRIRLRGKNIADVLSMTVDEAFTFFIDEPQIRRSLDVLREVGLGYLRLGQPATELSGGEAQRIKLATELQRTQREGTVYILDEPTTGLHPADVDRLMKQLQRLVDSGATVVVVEHDMRVIAESDWVIDMGPGAGIKGGKVVAAGTPAEVARSNASLTGRYIARFLDQTT